MKDGCYSQWPIPDLMGDERRLKQVLINLIRNAFKFTHKGHIKVLACYNEDSETLTVEVQDTGLGIAAEDFDRLFTRWGKLHRTAAQNNEGLGLGLTIVEQIVKLAKG